MYSLIQTFIYSILLMSFICENNSFVNKCPKNWSNYRNRKCLKVLTESKHNFSESIIKCNELNASLVSIESKDENLLIESLLYGLRQTNGLFIGLNRKRMNDTYINAFQWMDTRVDLKFENWAEGEPNHPFEPCVEIYAVAISAGKWNDLSCGAKRGVICQRAVEREGVENEVMCEHLGYIQYRESCYKGYKTRLEWSQANRKCAEDKGSLLWIEDSYEHSFIRYWTQTSLNSSEFWIGLSANNNSLNLRYEWLKDWPLYYTAWAAGEPHYRHYLSQQCVSQDRESGLWRNNAYCDDRRAFVCKINEKPIPGEHVFANGFCPKAQVFWINLHKHSKHCYYFGDNEMNWTMASKHCRSLNSTLVSIHSRHELELLQPFVREKSRHVWIGLYQSPSGSFRWEDGSALSFTNWFPGEPTDEKNELCVEMRAQDMTWNDVKCDAYKLPFICETDKIGVNLSATTPASAGQESESSGQLSGGLIILIVLIVLLFFAVFIAAVVWKKQFFCVKVLTNTGMTTHSNRDSVNERNTFDVT